MAEKKGICRNYVNCELADKEEIQTVDDINFVCAKCHKPLEEVGGKKQGGGFLQDPNKRKLLIVIAAAVVVIGGGVGAFLGIKSSNDKKALIEAARLDSIRAAQVADSIRAAQVADSLAAAAANDAALADSLRAAHVADSLRQVAIADSIRVADSIANAKKKPTTTGGSASGSYSLGYGSYSGPMQGGKPHGAGGTIKVTRSYQLDLKDGRGSTLQLNVGDRIENAKFENGRLRSGELQRTDGTRKWFNC